MKFLLERDRIVENTVPVGHPDAPIALDCYSTRYLRSVLSVKRREDGREKNRSLTLQRARELRVRSRDVAVTAQRPRDARAHLLCMYTRIYHGDTH